MSKREAYAKLLRLIHNELYCIVVTSDTIYLRLSNGVTLYTFKDDWSTFDVSYHGNNVCPVRYGYVDSLVKVLGDGWHYLRMSRKIRGIIKHWVDDKNVLNGSFMGVFRVWDM